VFRLSQNSLKNNGNCEFATGDQPFPMLQKSHRLTVPMLQKSHRLTVPMVRKSHRLTVPMVRKSHRRPTVAYATKNCPNF